MGFARYSILRAGIALLLSALGMSAACAGALPLIVELSAEKTEIALLEACPVQITFRNNGRSPLKLYLHMFKEEQIGSILIRRPRGEPDEIRTPIYRALSHDGTPVFRRLEPGEQISMTLALSCNWQAGSRSVFDTPGRYNLSVRYDDGAVAVESKPVGLSVVRPPTSERKAFKLVQELPHPAGLYENDFVYLLSDEQREEMIARLEEIASIEESVIYANYARLSLAWGHLMAAQLAGSWPDRYDREKELAAAESLLGAIKNKNFTLANKVDKLRKQLKEFKAAAESAKE